MLPISPEDQVLLNYHTTELACLMHKYTEPDKLENFESTEVELRNQLQSLVSPTIGEFFFLKEEKNAREINESSKP